MHREERMINFGLVGLLLVAATSTAPVEVTGGVVQGNQLGDGSTIFYGIPYAAPPTGNLRWKPPQPVVPWSGVRDATRPLNPCIQHDEGWNNRNAKSGQEDCLYLSVHAPKHATNARLPVIFWIHGGSNRAGSGYRYADSLIYRRGVVLVALEYRLGVFGFMSLPELTAESPHHTSGNYGILDQVAALEWVKHNITRFGGDPDNVTIMGQSAGAFDVGVLLLSPLARGLFAKAVMESGNPGLGLPTRSLAQNEAVGVQLEHLVHGPRGTSDLAALRSASAQEILEQGERLTPPPPVDPRELWGQAIIDGWLLPRPPKELFAAGQQAQIPLIIGSNTREFSFGGDRDLLRQLIKDIFGSRAGAVLAAYGLDRANLPEADPALGDVGTQFTTDLVFRCPAKEIVELQREAGLQVWHYQFGVPAPGAHTVAHSGELNYVFDTPAFDPDSAPWPPLQQYWVQFAQTGNPNGGGLPEWSESGKEGNYVDFTPQGQKLGKDLRGTVCRQLTRSR
jgi:para-nitrobenzyl esterase